MVNTAARVITSHFAIESFSAPAGRLAVFIT